MSKTVLFVDDEINILKSLERLFVDYDYTLLTAVNAERALELFQNHEVAVAVSDHMMPGCLGVEFFHRLKEISPHTVKILMTGYGDLSIALAAINSGEVYRFILKPWNDDQMVQSVEQAMVRYQTTMAMRREDESILRSLAQTIELKDPYTGGHCSRVARYAHMIAKELNLSRELIKDIRFGSWLHDCGKIGVPEAILNANGSLNSSEFAKVQMHPFWGAQVARQANFSQEIINIIIGHHERFDGRGYPEGLAGRQIPLSARIVAVADVFDALTTDRPYHKATTKLEALAIISEAAGSQFDPDVVQAFAAALNKFAADETTDFGGSVDE